ncbi:MAG: hypothetical protein ACXAE3_14710 [Candidatus Kariarchaeaceae archaeon]|jgi:hypothetical protein
MSSVEQTVQSILPLIRYHFIGRANHRFGQSVDDIEYISTQTIERRGVTGRVLISTIAFSCKFGEMTDTLAFKFFEDKASAMTEMKNAMELDIRFRTAPEFGIPRIIFSSTQDPTLIIYEGVKGTNYDELLLDGKQEEAGRLLSAIHGAEARAVDIELYKNLVRMLGSHLSVLGREQQISKLLSMHFERMTNAMSGTNPFSDFHQSNVMLNVVNDMIMKAYVIDPEFMQKGSFDRMEDVGTFFGAQGFLEFQQTGGVPIMVDDLNRFLKGYEEKSLEMRGYRWTEMYPNGNPVGFFIAQWGLMDALDYALNRGGDLASTEVQSRLDYVIFILQNVDFRFPTS